MNVLFVGGAKASWQVRGRQIAAALGARATVRPTASDWQWADVIVLVKNAAETHGQAATATGKPIVWDVLDSWRQPRDNGQPRDFHVNLIRQMEPCHVEVLIGATRQMAADIALPGLPASGVYIPHHSRIGLVPTPPRPKAEVVGYDGSPRYLGRWAGALEAACHGLGLRFVVNPPDLSTVDVLVSFRDAEWDGWACRQWKSGVKYVNAIAAGRPVVTQPSAAYSELRPFGSVVDTFHELLSVIFDTTRLAARERAFEEGRIMAPCYTVDAIAEQYRALLRQVAEGRAA